MQELGLEIIIGVLLAYISTVLWIVFWIQSSGRASDNQKRIHRMRADLDGLWHRVNKLEEQLKEQKNS